MSRNRNNRPDGRESDPRSTLLSRLRGHEEAPAIKKATPPSVTVDSAAGPSVEVHPDRAAARLHCRQQGLADARTGLYDKFSFIGGVSTLYIRVLRKRIAQLITQADHEEQDDLNVADILITQATTGLTGAEGQVNADEAEMTKAQNDVDRHMKVLLGNDPVDSDLWRAPERVGERRIVTLLLMFGIPLCGYAIEAPFTYFAFQVLAESTMATVATAGIVGFCGVVLAHLCGLQARLGRGAARRARIRACAACAVCLVAIGWFMASIRTAALTAPVATNSGVTKSGLSYFGLNRATVFIGWLAVSFGLWIGVALLAYHHTNPHVSALQRACVALKRASNKVIASTTKAKYAKLRVENALTAKARLTPMWQSYRQQLTEFVDELAALYLHGLATEMADPEFTTAVEGHDDQNARVASVLQMKFPVEPDGPDHEEDKRSA
jgi:hypothetical protein